MWQKASWVGGSTTSKCVRVCVRVRTRTRAYPYTFSVSLFLFPPLPPLTRLACLHVSRVGETPRFCKQAELGVILCAASDLLCGFRQPSHFSEPLVSSFYKWGQLCLKMPGES